MWATFYFFWTLTLFGLLAPPWIRPNQSVLQGPRVTASPPIVIEGAAGEDGHNGYSIVAGVKERERGREGGAISGLFEGQDAASTDRSFDCLWTFPAASCHQQKWRNVLRTLQKPTTEVQALPIWALFTQQWACRTKLSKNTFNNMRQAADQCNSWTVHYILLSYLSR